DRLQVDRAHLARAAGLGPDDGRRDGAGRQLVDRRDLAGIQAGARDPDAIADLEPRTSRPGRQVDRRNRRALIGRISRATRASRLARSRGARCCVTGRRVGGLALAGGHWLSGPPDTSIADGPNQHAICALAGSGTRSLPYPDDPTVRSRSPAACLPLTRDWSLAHPRKPPRRTTAAASPTRRGCGRATSRPPPPGPPSPDARCRRASGRHRPPRTGSRPRSRPPGRAEGARDTPDVGPAPRS